MRIVVAFAGIMCIIFLFLFYKPVPFSDQSLVETTVDETINLASTGLPDPSSFTALMTDYVEEYALSKYITSFVENVYIAPSSNPAIFERSWGLTQNLIYDQTSSIHTRGYLFQDNADRYYAIIDYRVRYDDKMIDSSYLTINTSADLEYWVVAHSASLFIKDKEYVIGETVSYHEGDTYYFKPYRNLSIIHETIYQGIMLIEIADPGNFFHLDVDFYQAVHQTSSYRLGFNEIKANSYIKYIPKSMELIYEAEEI